jgi:hypothetical protein
MKVDRHRNVADDLEVDLLCELEGITTQLRGKMTQWAYSDPKSTHKKIVIEYDHKQK